MSEQDVADVVKQVVTKAKAGDPKAQQVFFDYVVGVKNKPTQISIHNHYPETTAGSIVEAAARDALAKRMNGQRQRIAAGEE